MTKFKVLIINVLTLFVISIEAGDIIVNTNYGKVKGEQLQTFLDNRNYYSFKGIPYAQPPIGDLRFKPPQKPEPWSDVRNADDYGNICVQGNFLNPNEFSGDEDCLFINVFTTGTEMMITEMLLTDNIIENLNTQFEIHLPLAETNINYNSKVYQEIANKIRKHYFNYSGTIHTSQRKNYIDLLSDVYFVYGIHKTINIYATKSTGKIYNWIYSGIPEVGALHTEDTSYIFSRNSRWPIVPAYDDFSDEIVNIIETLTSMIVEFARSGNPTPNQHLVDFKSVKIGAYNFLNITRTELISSVDPPKSKTFVFWDSIFEEYFGKRPLNLKNEL